MLKAIHGLRSVVVVASYANERLMNKLLASSSLFACRREESLASSASELHERFPKRKTFRHLIIIPHILGILQFALDSVDGKFMWLSDCRENDRGREASSDDSVGNGIEKYLNNFDDQAFSVDCLLSFWFFYDNLPRWQINRKRRLVNKRARNQLSTTRTAHRWASELKTWKGNLHSSCQSITYFLSIAVIHSIAMMMWWVDWYSYLIL